VDLTRNELEDSEAREDKYWLNRLKQGTYPCELCNRHSHKEICDHCKGEDV